MSALLAASRNNSRSRKHHLVPASYLRRWTRNEALYVTDLSISKTYPAAAEVAARVTDFYEIRDSQIDEEETPPMLMETMLSMIEGSMVGAIDRLIDSGVKDLEVEQIQSICRYVGFQATRGQHVRQLLLELSSQVAKLEMASQSDAMIRERLLASGQEATDEDVAEVKDALNAVKEGVIEIRAPKPMLIWLAADVGENAWPFLVSRRWMVCHSFTEILTSDEPVLFVSSARRQDLSPRGLGLSSVIVFPLDPHHLLAMFHPDMPLGKSAMYAELLPSESEEINLALAWNASRWVFQRAKSRRMENIWIPPTQDKKLMLTRTMVNHQEANEIAHLRSAPRIHPLLPGLDRPVDRWFNLADEIMFCDRPYDPDRISQVLIDDWPRDNPSK